MRLSVISSPSLPGAANAHSVDAPLPTFSTGFRNGYSLYAGVNAAAAAAAMPAQPR